MKEHLYVQKVILVPVLGNNVCVSSDCIGEISSTYLRTFGKSGVVVHRSQFHGTCVTLEVGSYQHYEKLPIANDSVSSIMIGSNVFATFCQDGDFKGICNTLFTNVEDLNMFTVGTDSISSFNIELRTCLPTPDQVTLFEEAGYGGKCVLLKQGTYLDPQAIGMDKAQWRRGTENG